MFILALYNYVIIKVGIDLIGPLPTTSHGNKYIVTLVDYFSKWPEAAPLKDKTAVMLPCAIHGCSRMY